MSEFCVSTLTVGLMSGETRSGYGIPREMNISTCCQRTRKSLFHVLRTFPLTTSCFLIGLSTKSVFATINVSYVTDSGSCHGSYRATAILVLLPPSWNKHRSSPYLLEHSTIQSSGSMRRRLRRCWGLIWSFP